MNEKNSQNSKLGCTFTVLFNLLHFFSIVVFINWHVLLMQAIWNMPTHHIHLTKNIGITMRFFFIHIITDLHFCSMLQFITVSFYLLFLLTQKLLTLNWIPWTRSTSSILKVKITPRHKHPKMKYRIFERVRTMTVCTFINIIFPSPIFGSMKCVLKYPQQ